MRCAVQGSGFMVQGSGSGFSFKVQVQGSGTGRALSTVGMRTYIAALVCVALGAAVVSAQEQNARRKPAAARQVRQKAEPALECGNPLGFQVLLDRRGFSPGAI